MKFSLLVLRNLIKKSAFFMGGLLVAIIVVLVVDLFLAKPVFRNDSPHQILPEEFVHLEKIYLRSFISTSFLISDVKGITQILISNEMPAENLQIAIRCEQKFRGLFDSIIRSTNFQDEIESRPEVIEKVFPLMNRNTIAFAVTNQVRSCRVIFQELEHSEKKGQVQIKRDTELFPWLTELSDSKDSCPLQIFQPSAPLEYFFNSYQQPQLSCKHKIDRINFLETPEKGLIAKAEILLGQELDPPFIQNQNPFALLDFSKAPKLKAILLSTLVFRSDFYGNLMARLLKFHAERGTLVYIISTDYMMLEKDKKLLHDLAAQFPNFRLQEFRYNDPDNKLTMPFRFLDTKYRDMHIKLFVTLSDVESQNSIIFGGRNIHDGFLFKTKPDYSKLPELVQYGTEEDFVHWNDLEAKIISKSMANVTFAHMLKFWNRDAYTQGMEGFANSNHTFPFELNGEVRSFISVPYEDGHALEDLYVNLINSAQKTIKISSPYLRPTVKILKAIDNALKRNVEITLQTRVELEGDTQAWLYEEVNKESINQLFEKVKIYKWNENSILHSKFILVDNQVAFMGSANLSRRSFIQDTENGFLIKNGKFANELNSIFESYIAKSELITKSLPRKMGPTILIHLFENQF